MCSSHLLFRPRRRACDPIGHSPIDKPAWGIGTNPARGAAVEVDLNAGAPRVRFIALDLSNLHAARAFAQRFQAEVPSLDVLANVARVLLAKRLRDSR